MSVVRFSVALMILISLATIFYVVSRYLRAHQFPAVNSTLDSNESLTLAQYLAETKKYDGTYCKGNMEGFWGNFYFSEYVSNGVARFDFAYPDKTILHEILNETGLYAWNDTLSFGYQIPTGAMVPHKGPISNEDTRFNSGSYGCAPLWFRDDEMFKVPEDKIYKAYPDK